MSGPYLLLYTYLDTRFADTVVLTFAQIEDLVGFALPAQARVQPEWWTDATTNVVAPHHSDSWRLARRTAVPNLTAQIVSFARAFLESGTLREHSFPYEQPGLRPRC